MFTRWGNGSITIKRHKLSQQFFCLKICPLKRRPYKAVIAWKRDRRVQTRSRSSLCYTNDVLVILSITAIRVIWYWVNPREQNLITSQINDHYYLLSTMNQPINFDLLYGSDRWCTVSQSTRHISCQCCIMSCYLLNNFLSFIIKISTKCSLLDRVEKLFY